MQIEKAKNEVELERLKREHRTLDEQISQFESRRYLTPNEESEVRRLKKLKLQKKDEIAALARRASA